MNLDPDENDPDAKMARVKAKLRGKLPSGFGIRQSSATNEPSPDLTAVTQTVVTLVINDVAEKEKEKEHEKPVQTATTSSFFAEYDIEAKSILSEIGVDTEIMVVPMGVMLGGPLNDAITIKSTDQVEQYGQTVAEEAARLGTVDPVIVRGRVKLNTILVRRRLMEEEDIKKKGQIWHEYGHVRGEAEESGNVFAYELACIRAKFPDQARWWVVDYRKLRYFARFATSTGYDDLLAQLVEILSPEEFESFTTQRNEGKSVKPAKKWAAVSTQGVIKKGESILGMIDDLRRRLGLPIDSTETIPDTVKQNDEIDFGNHRWKVIKIAPGDPPEHTEYTLKRLDGDES